MTSHERHVSKHIHLHCLFNSLLKLITKTASKLHIADPYKKHMGCRSKKTPKLRVTGLCAGNSPLTGEFLAQMASDAENVSIWWRFFHCLAVKLGWIKKTDVCIFLINNPLLLNIYGLEFQRTQTCNIPQFTSKITMACSVVIIVQMLKQFQDVKCFKTSASIKREIFSD